MENISTPISDIISSVIRGCLFEVNNSELWDRIKCGIRNECVRAKYDVVEVLVVGVGSSLVGCVSFRLGGEVKVVRFSLGLLVVE